MSSTRSLIILSRDGIVHALATIAGEHGYAATCLNSLIALDDIDLSDAVLISMSSGVIVPRRMIDRLSAAYNFHGATPTYPGRDPHYWALLDGAAEFGCTAHVMLPIGISLDLSPGVSA
ncbi:MAG TPA: hypothetical protein EYQ81_16100 [Sneathiellales bacterium]|nr:hypothetical protein [Sneathiellales bacterium]